MVWGGSLNQEGTDYLKNIKKADDVVQFLEKLTHHLSQDEKDQVKTVIEIITNFISKLSEKGK